MKKTLFKQIDFIVGKENYSAKIFVDSIGYDFIIFKDQERFLKLVLNINLLNDVRELERFKQSFESGRELENLCKDAVRIRLNNHLN